jgi:ribonuclease J
MSAHADLARGCGASPIMLEDGDVLGLAPGHPEVIDSAPVGRLVLDGNRVVPMEGGVLAARRRMLFNGIVLGSVAIDSEGRVVGKARVSAPGLLEPDDPETLRVAGEFGRALSELPIGLRTDDAALADAAKAALRRAFGRRLQKRPMVDVHLLRV